jgi:hypothetical protein
VVHVGWVIGALLAASVLWVIPVVLLLRANQSLVRAIVARNPQEYVALERTAGRVPKRVIPEKEIDFIDRPPAPLGLR